MESLDQALRGVSQSIENAAKLAGRPDPVHLLAVSKTRPPEAVRALAAAGQRAFGENYVQEGIAKIRALADLGLEWHLIGHLQSNKAADAAQHFDWVQSLDRAKLVLDGGDPFDEATMIDDEEAPKLAERPLPGHESAEPADVTPVGAGAAR